MSYIWFLLYTDRLLPSAAENAKKKTIQIDASTVEIEERGVKLRLTVVDTPGFGDAMDNTDSFQQIIRYIDEQFERLDSWDKLYSSQNFKISVPSGHNLFH